MGWGLGFLFVGGSRMHLDQRYRHAGKEATATVTYHTSHQAGLNPVSNSRTDYHFTTPDGTRITGSQTEYSSRIGEQVKIEYLPESPRWNRFVGGGRRYEAWNLPMAIGGLLFFVAGAYATIRAWRKP